MAAPSKISELVERYRDNRDDLRSASYKEARIRIEFIDPFFECLGWDVANREGYAEAYKEVIYEDSLDVEGSKKAPDYAFRIGGVRKFFVEAKAPLVDIKHSPSPAYQLRRYGWSAKLPLSILTDFEEFSIYDCRKKPAPTDKASAARTMYMTFDEYEDRWSEISDVFSRQAILKGAFDKYASQGARRGTAEVDDAFLADIEGWREKLAFDIAAKNKTLDVRELNDAVQKIIDRVVFLRIAEDRGFEPYGALQEAGRGRAIYEKLTALFLRADDRYNSGLFHFNPNEGAANTLDRVTLSARK